MTMRRIISASLLALAIPLHASVIGTSVAAESITADRIARLPPGERAAWTAYLLRSDQQRAADHAALAAERKPGMPIPPVPKEVGGARGMPLDRDPAFYASPEARHTADVIVSFQTPAGGWGKNMDFTTGDVRQPGQAYVSNNLSQHLSEIDFDRPKDPDWNYVGTVDNDATTTQIQFLAKVQAAAPGKAGEAYRASCLRGIEYLLKAQFPNGGWPQVWPLEGGYHDAITFNDDAVTEVAEVLKKAGSDAAEYAFVPARLRGRALTAAAGATRIILRAQSVIKGKKTVWGQQVDALTLEPVAGRNYEPAALSSGESAKMLEYLMAIDKPAPEVVAAIEAGIDWLQGAAAYGATWIGDKTTAGGRRLVPKVGAGPLWARYYSFTTGKPIFGDRDRTIHDDVNELSLERRNGYGWWSDGPKHALDTYAAWKQKRALESGGHGI